MKTFIINTTDKKLKKSLEMFISNGKMNFRNKGMVSNILAQYIVDNVDVKYIKLFLRNSNYKPTPEFYKYIECNIKKYINRKLRIYDLFTNYIENNEYLNFEGFIRFRLRDYYKTLETIIGEIVEEYKGESEYRKFISIIRSFLKTQVCIVTNLNIYKVSEDRYLIYDDYYNDITEICEKEFINEFGDYNLSKNALILNAILTLAPDTVTFHKCSHVSDYEIIKAVSDVYENEMHCCQNCILCRENK